MNALGSDDESSSVAPGDGAGSRSDGQPDADASYGDGQPDGGAGSSSSDGQPRDCYLMLVAIRSKQNIGTVLRSAVAFGAKEVLVIGSKRQMATHGAHGTDRFMNIRYFAKLKEAVAWCKARGIAICGIEITHDAVPVHTHPWRGATAFLAGAEGEGLVNAHKAVCDSFVYIPQHRGGTASLNVSVAVGIVLHHFAIAAGFPEAEREAGRDKFVVPAPTDRRGAALTPFDLELQAQRRAAHAAAAGAAASEPDVCALDATALVPAPDGAAGEAWAAAILDARGDT